MCSLKLKIKFGKHLKLNNVALISLILYRQMHLKKKVIKSNESVLIWHKVTCSWSKNEEKPLNKKNVLPLSTKYVVILLVPVKLPSLLYTANQPDKENQPRILPERKLKALIHHLQMFLTLVCQHICSQAQNSCWYFLC